MKMTFFNFFKKFFINVYTLIMAIAFIFFLIIFKKALQKKSLIKSSLQML